jgi:hypothetical protein
VIDPPRAVTSSFPATSIAHASASLPASAFTTVSAERTSGPPGGTPS